VPQDQDEAAELIDDPNLAHIGRREISTSLAGLGEQLIPRFGDRVRVNTAVSQHFSFDAPLSWKNHTWHHTIPVNIDIRTPNELRDRMCNVLGLLASAIPQDQGAVLTYVRPATSVLADQAVRELEFVRAQAQKRVRLAALAATDDDGVDTHVVEQMLTADVMLPLVAG
jgi:hypothetical protein